MTAPARWPREEPTEDRDAALLARIEQLEALVRKLTRDVSYLKGAQPV
jgi:hypothetical protein